MPLSQAISKLMLAVMLVVGSVAVLPGAALAQEATPAAGACEAPELPSGTPTPFEEMEGPPAEASPAASPAAIEEAGAAVATEEVVDATAEAAAAPVGDPVDQATTDEATAAIENAYACYNMGEYLAVGALFTPNGLLSEFGTENPYDLPLYLEGGPPIAIDSISDVRTSGDGQFSADVVSRFGQQLQHERWTLIAADGFLLIDETPELPVELPADADVTTVEATMIDFAFDLSEQTVPASDYLVFDAPNEGEYFHEIAILKLPEGVEFSMELLEADEPPEGTEFLGGSAAPPGESAQLVLADVEPGVYTLLCFVDEPDGVPHAEKGMVAKLTVE